MRSQRKFKKNRKRATIERGDPLCSDDPEIPEWLQEFREKLVDDEIPVRWRFSRQFLFTYL